MKGTRGYIFSRSFMGERVPQHVQNLVIRDYCQKNGLHYLLSMTEYSMEGCFLILEHALAELPLLEGIAAYSLYLLPEDAGDRHQIYDRVLQENRVLHFAVEGLSLRDRKDVNRIEDLWKVRLTLPYCLNFQESNDANIKELCDSFAQSHQPQLSGENAGQQA